MFEVHTRRVLAAGALSVAMLPAAAGAAEPTREELMRRIEQLESQLQELKDAVQQTDRKAEAAVTAAERATDTGRDGESWADRTTIGGYGELHYNNLDSKKEIDFHRFVLFAGHEFDDRTRLFSEIEFEHALTVDTDDGSGPGAVELEQAYVERDFTPGLSGRGGVFLVPVGILNETHEPPTFYGVERNPVENAIIPTTWWEGGAGLTGRGGNGWSWDLAFHSGLEVPVDGDDAFLVRDGRGKVAKQVAEDWAMTGRIRWSAIPGLEVAATAQYQQDVTQGALGVSATLFETHVALQRGPFGLRALYARWDLDGNEPEALGRDEQEGFYIEPSWKPVDSLGFFARYNVWNNEAGLGGEDNEQVDIGVNYWPHPDVVIKADIQQQTGKADNDGFNVGIGYQF